MFDMLGKEQLTLSKFIDFLSINKDHEDERKPFAGMPND